MIEPKILDADLSHLSKSELDAIERLKVVGEIVHKMWLAQVDPGKGMVNVYPDGVTKKEVLLAAKKDSAITSPYTFVEESNGRLKAVHYRDKFDSEIDEVVKILKECADILEDSETKSYFTKLAKAWDKGDFDEALNVYLKNGHTRIEVLMGPLETYEDKLLGYKKSFQFNLRVLREKETEDSDKFIQLFKTADILNPTSMASKEIQRRKVTFRVDDVLMFSGRQSNTQSTGTNLPNETDLAEKMGTKILVYRNALEYKFRNNLSWLMDRIDIKGKDVKLEDAMEGELYSLAFHEITEGLVKFDGYEERLQNYSNAIRELNATLLGMKSAKYHFLKGVFTQEEMEDMLVATLIYSVDVCLRHEESSSIDEYAKGFALLFNYASRIGAVEFSTDKVSVDLARLSEAIDIMGGITLQIFEFGDADDAERLFNEYGSYEIFKKLPQK
ncbi:MAG: hypothetical protein QY318_03075 [Candidatus Dojkabacteria bacterium]|nr:MAG: hypothetical protein QY318_03075 [Candidatus Dojkabacteria bacterium]